MTANVRPSFLRATRGERKIRDCSQSSKLKKKKRVNTCDGVLNWGTQVHKRHQSEFFI